VDTRVTALSHHRVDLAQTRIDRGELPAFAEYDLFRGLTGMGAHLLRHAPGSNALERILTYLVRLTEPVRIDGECLPGWWVCHDPRLARSDDFPGGHSNQGVAHGISGVLAVLALSLRCGITVNGHTDSIARICAWLDTWRRDTDSGPWWPQWITRAELRAGRPNQQRPGRASWCYGTPGLARAQQLAALATGDTARQRMAEHALAGCLTDPVQLATIRDTSLCHGWAGLYQTAWRAAREALTPKISASLPHLVDLLTRHGRPGQSDDAGFLEGDAGLALALHTAAYNVAPTSGWDACLLID
jgi:hypothetical protein